jgi:glycosyltransferase involved in cell wall biosynthesis
MILFVTEKFPWPLDDGGQIRTYQILKSLSAQFSVILVALRPFYPEYEEPIRRLGVEVITVPPCRSARMLPWYLLQSLFTKRPYPLSKNFSRGILCEIRRRIIIGDVRAIHLNHLDAAQYLDWLQFVRAQPKLVFDTHNLLTSLYSRLTQRESNVFRQAFYRIQWRKTRMYEHATMHRADLVIVCSELERQVLDEWGVRNCLVIPNGVDTEFFTPGPDGCSPRNQPVHLVFTGAMDYLPNADGLRWFFRSVMPELDRVLSHYKLTIVGKNPPADLLARERPGRIEFTGRVEDVRPYSRLADVFVVPLRIGGGTRLKVLEALAMQVPVVSTRLGAEGLDLSDGVHLRLADDSSAMAQAIAELCACPDGAREMARRGRERVLGRYDWRSVTYSLGRYYEQVLHDVSPI